MEEIGTALARTETDNLPAVGSLVDLVRERPDLSVEVLERLVALQERITEREAEMAMAEALNAFQADCPPVPRTATAKVTKGGTVAYEYHFAPLDEIVKVIGPYLKKHGLSYTHDSAIVDREVEVTCTLQHILGAKRTATFRGPVDNSGGKNALQGVGSARSYGRRYTLTDVLGLTTEDDNDGAGSGERAEYITASQAADLEALIEEVGADKPRFLKWLGVAHAEALTQDRLPEAIKALEDKRAKGEK